MVGRCISLWNNPFLGDIRSFSGVHILHPSSSEAREKKFIFLLKLSVSGFHCKMSPNPRCTYAFAKGKWVVWISRNTPVTTQVLPQITKEHQVMYCFQTLSQKNIYFVCTWHFWCKQSGVFFQLKRSGHIFFDHSWEGTQLTQLLVFQLFEGMCFASKLLVTTVYVLFRIIFWWVSNIETTQFGVHSIYT